LRPRGRSILYGDSSDSGVGAEEIQIGDRGRKTAADLLRDKGEQEGAVTRDSYSLSSGGG